MMIEVVFFHITGVGIAEFVKMCRVVDPLLNDVSLEKSGHYDRRRKRRKKKNTYRSTNDIKWHEIAKIATHVTAVKRIFVMSKVKRVKDPVGEYRKGPLKRIIGHREMMMEYMLVGHVLGQHPQQQPGGYKRDRPQGVSLAYSKNEHNDRIRSVKKSRAIDLMT